jgi:hypothetical protein
MFFKTGAPSHSHDNDLLENTLLTAWLESSDMGLCVLDRASCVVMLNPTLRNYRKDGTQFMNELFISPIKDQAGVVTHFLGIQHLRGHELPPVAQTVRAL